MSDESPLEFAAALEAGLKLLSKKDASERVVREVLLKGEFSPTVVDLVVHRLKSKRILDDARLAETHTQNRLAKGVGLEKLRVELERMGLEAETIEVATTGAGSNQAELAVEALRKRLRATEKFNHGRAARFLASRGFSEEDVETAVRVVLGAIDSFAE